MKVTFRIKNKEFVGGGMGRIGDVFIEAGSIFQQQPDSSQGNPCRVFMTKSGPHPNPASRPLHKSIRKSVSFEDHCVSWIDHHAPPRNPEEDRILHALRRAVINQGNRDRARNLSSLCEAGGFDSGISEEP